MSQRIHYVSGDAQKPETFEKLKQTLQKLDKQQGTPGNYMFYLSVAPQLFATTINGLADHGLMKEDAVPAEPGPVE